MTVGCRVAPGGGPLARALFCQPPAQKHQAAVPDATRGMEKPLASIPACLSSVSHHLSSPAPGLQAAQTAVPDTTRGLEKPLASIPACLSSVSQNLSSPAPGLQAAQTRLVSDSRTTRDWEKPLASIPACLSSGGHRRGSDLDRPASLEQQAADTGAKDACKEPCTSTGAGLFSLEPAGATCEQPCLKAANPLLCDPPGASFEGLTGMPRSSPGCGPSDQFSATISFRGWSAALPRWVIKSRSPFAALLAATFSSPASRWGAAPPSATFPLPLPCLGLFEASGPRLSKASWRRLRLKRVLHVLVLALNYAYEGLRFLPLDLLWRVPNAHQRQAYDRLMRHLVACDSRAERFPLPPGRSGPESLARLLHLEKFSQVLFEHGYGCAGPPSERLGAEVQPNLCDRPELRPYRPLDTSRLKLTGQGLWEAEPWLQGPLWLPFVEPACMQHGRPLSGEDLPNFEAQSRSENRALSLLWSTQGLLALSPGDPPPGYRSRVFNAYKDPTRDRQIGDRACPTRENAT